VNYTFAVIALTGSFLASSCGVVVLSRGFRSPKNHVFFLASFFIALFNLSQFLSLITPTAHRAEIYLRMGYISFTFVSVVLLHFVYLFTKKNSPRLGLGFYPALYASAFIISYLCVRTDLFFSGVRKTPFGFVHIYGGHYGWFALFAVGVFLSIIYLLIDARRNAKKVSEKKQYAWIFGGFLFAFIFAFIFQVILPALNMYYVTMLPTASLLLLASFTVAITRYGLLIVTPSFLSQNIINTMQGMLFFVDQENIIRMVNKSFTEELGYFPNEVIGAPYEKLETGKVPGETLRLDVEIKDGIKTSKARVLKKDKSSMPVNVRASAVTDSFGDKIGQIFILLNLRGEERMADEQKQTIEELTKTKEHMLSILEDATEARDEEKKRTEEINRLYEDLKGVDTMKTEFLSVISHELRTPITPIKGFTSMLLSNQMGPLTEAQRNAITVVAKEGEHLLGLIDSILEVSRLERGKAIDIVKEPVLISSLVKELVDVLRPQYQERNISFGVDIPDNFPTILGDAGKLRRLLTNLVGNSMKFTPHGGKIQITGTKKEGYIEMQVIDNGIGIAKENIGKLFQRFYQVDSSYSRSAGGVGLGLSIAKGIVEAHGGKIWAESEGPGKGTKIIFTLPLGA